MLLLSGMVCFATMLGANAGFICSCVNKGESLPTQAVEMISCIHQPAAPLRKGCAKHVANCSPWAVHKFKPLAGDGYTSSA